ncbi:MAG: hypothetical protein U9Q70_13835, partial [Chloroflexota bacterium]|nr:hypothetical protein [Chloroflexota bacterium]
EVIAPTAEGEMLSGDDALTWLQSLTAGKEEELRAQAKVEQQARVDEIMGRKRTPPPTEPVAEEAVVVPPPEEVTPAAAAEVIAPVVEEVAIPTEEELRAQVEAERQARVDKIMGRQRPAPSAKPVVKETVPPEEIARPPEESAEEKKGELFGWSSFDARDRKPRKPPQPPAHEEKLVPSFGFTSFKQRPTAPKPAKEESVAPSTIVEEPPVAVSAEPLPQPEVRKPIAKVTPVEKAKEIIAPSFDLVERKDYVQANKNDHPARLELAQALLASNKQNEALPHYEYLTRHAEGLLDNVISNLREYTQANPEESKPLQLLGDAYMKQGSTQQALQAYRKAMAGL